MIICELHGMMHNDPSFDAAHPECRGLGGKPWVKASILVAGLIVVGLVTGLVLSACTAQAKTECTTINGVSNCHRVTQFCWFFCSGGEK